MQISIFANFALMKARGWSYKSCYTNVTFNRKVSVLHKLNFHLCHRIFLKAGCRLLLLRWLWQFGWKTQSISWMTLTQISSLRSCTSPPLWQLPACHSHLQAPSFKTLSMSGGWATPPQKKFLKKSQRNKTHITILAHCHVGEPGETSYAKENALNEHRQLNLIFGSCI